MMRNQKKETRKRETQTPETREEEKNDLENSVEVEKLAASNSTGPSSILSPELLVLRDGLGDNQEALEAFDSFVERLGAQKATQVLTNMAASDKGLAGSLLRRGQKKKEKITFSNDAHFSTIDALIARTQQLGEDMEATAFEGKNFYPTASPHNGASFPNSGWEDWRKRVAKEHEHLVELKGGTRKATSDFLQGIENNLSGIEAEFLAAVREGEGSLANNDVYYSGGSIDIDVISPDGTRWIEVKSKKPFGTGSNNWSDEILPKAQKMLMASKEAPYNSTVTTLVFDFPKGVTVSVFEALTALGFEVLGEVVQG